MKQFANMLSEKLNRTASEKKPVLGIDNDFKKNLNIDDIEQDRKNMVNIEDLKPDINLNKVSVQESEKRQPLHNNKK